MRAIKVILPLAITAVGALAAGIATLSRKTAPAAAAKPAKNAPPVPTGPQAEGAYSFISGFKDAATVELKLRYFPESMDFAVVSEDFLCYSSASHVALLHAEGFDMQIEYAPYYAGEDFALYTKGVEQKFGGVAPVRYAALEGIRYRDGDAMCLCFPIPEDAYSYVQFILFKRSDDDQPLEALPESPLVKALMDSVVIEKK